MVNSSNSQIETWLLKTVGRLSLGMGTFGTKNVVKILCDEVDRRIAADADSPLPNARFALVGGQGLTQRYCVSSELACIAKKARALLD